jgi:hypothetical protein
MNSITFNHINKAVDAETLEECEQRFYKQLRARTQKGLQIENSSGASMNVEVNIVNQNLSRYAGRNFKTF